MAINFAIAQAGNVTGPWTDIHAGGRSSSFPMRVRVTGNFAADNVYIDSYDDGDAANFETLATFAAVGDVIIQTPVEWLRVRTGPAMTGTCNVYGVPSA